MEVQSLPLQGSMLHHCKCAALVADNRLQAGKQLLKMQIDLQVKADIRFHASVSAGTMTRAKVDDLQMVCGFRNNPLSLHSDRALRPFWDPVAVMRWGWVHDTLSNDALTTEASLLLKARDAFVSGRGIETFFGR
jgi:hypothetical protein